MHKYTVKLIRTIIESGTVIVTAESEAAAKEQALCVVLDEVRWDDEQPATLDAVIVSQE